MATRMHNKRDDIISEFIRNLPFEGWNENNLSISASNINIDAGELKMLFPGGLEEFTSYFTETTEQVFKKRVKEAIKKVEGLKKKAKELMILKLRVYHEVFGDKEGFKKFISYFFNPLNAAAGLKGVYNFASDSWYLMGDSATDFSYYTKRVSFGGIYTKAAIYAINDESENLEDTEKFIERRIDDLMKFGKLKQKFNSLTNKLNFV